MFSISLIDNVSLFHEFNVLQVYFVRLFQVLLIYLLCLPIKKIKGSLISLPQIKFHGGHGHATQHLGL